MDERLPIEWPDPAVVIQPESTPEPPAAQSRAADWLVPMLAALLGAGVAVVAILVADVARSDSATPVDRFTELVRTEIVTPSNIEVNTQAAAVARRVVPSVVTVQIFNGPTLVGSGSGVVLDEDAGYIVTNEHVVDERQSVTIVLADGRRYEGDVLGTDIITDLAVVQIDAEGLIAVEQGSTEFLEVGDGAIAIGNPLGLAGGPTVTVGVLSAFDRVVEGDAPGDTLYAMIQTDAPFTRGSSGGALVDLEGRLIGITTAVGVADDLGAEGLGFATPIEVMNRVTKEIISTGVSTHGVLGIRGITQLSPRPDGGQAPIGVLVSGLLEGSTAGASGIESGDVITTVAGDSVTTINGLISSLRRFGPGDEVEVTVERDGEILTITFSLGERVDG